MLAPSVCAVVAVAALVAVAAWVVGVPPDSVVGAVPPASLFVAASSSPHDVSVSTAAARPAVHHRVANLVVSIAFASPQRGQRRHFLIRITGSPRDCQQIMMMF